MAARWLRVDLLVNTDEPDPGKAADGVLEESEYHGVVQIGDAEWVQEDD